jgi:2-phospho-L-lactate guanylyltransferase (CobY/MobA/RfbA family)
MPELTPEQIKLVVKAKKKLEDVVIGGGRSGGLLLLKWWQVMVRSVIRCGE